MVQKLKDEYLNYSLKRAIEDAKIKQKDLARLVGVHPSMVNHYIRMRAYPNPITARNIAQELHSRLKRTDSLDDYTEELFPERLKEMVPEIEDEREGHSEDVLNNAILLRSHNKKEIPPATNSLSESPERYDLTDGINVVLKTLDYREREIIKLRFGLSDGYPYNQEEVGHIFNLSVERIRQIETEALRKLQTPFRKKRLADFVITGD